MIRLRLFHRDDLANQIESRVLDEGELSVGRGAQADWAIADPERSISRSHLVIAHRGGMLTLRDTSSNGVLIGHPRQRVERDRAVPISRGEAVHFGPYVIVAEEDESAIPEPASAAPDSEYTPFGAPAGVDPDRGMKRSKRRDPFGSALKPDPVALESEPSQDGVDAWERRQGFAPGGWDATPPHLKPDHSKLIGSNQAWTEPPPPVAEAGLGFDAPFTSPILQHPPVSSGDVQIPSDWDSPVEARSPKPDIVAIDAPLVRPSPEPATAPVTPPSVASAAPGSSADELLFERFCAGAKLSPNAFAGEDRAALMERLGAVYRQAILGVADLMSERSALKNDYRMTRTTIRAEGNNPFKWVPPQRIAVELLRSEEGSGYSTGERALNDALHDIKAHMLCVLAGMRAALGSTFDLLSPSETDKRVAKGKHLIRAQRDAAAWTEFTELFAELRREADDSAEGPINKAFRQAYEQQLKELDGYGARR
jgi:type VI secretion system FHA domain protein